MSGLLRVDPPAVRAAQPEVDAMSDLVDAVSARLATALDAEGPCWGDDEVGDAFGDAYRPARREVATAFDRLAGRLHGLAETLARIADAADGADGRARDRMS